MTRCPSWRHVILTANGQSAVASYLGADLTAVHEAWSLTMLSPRGDRIAEITTFIEPAMFRRFGLEPTWRD
jgi:RNA polymerase sigma-70 factor (ECF subfamily)